MLRKEKPKKSKKTVIRKNTRYRVKESKGNQRERSEENHEKKSEENEIINFRRNQDPKPRKREKVFKKFLYQYFGMKNAVCEEIPKKECEKTDGCVWISDNVPNISFKGCHLNL